MSMIDGGYNLKLSNLRNSYTKSKKEEKDYIFDVEAEVANCIAETTDISSAIVKKSHNWISTQKKM